MKSKYLLSALLAAGLVTAARAGSTGDLIIGFSQPSVTTNYEVDLGNLASLVSTSQTGSPVSLGTLSSADLSSLFGSTWASSSTVTWGGIATSGSGGTVAVTQFDAGDTNTGINLTTGSLGTSSDFFDVGHSGNNQRTIAAANVETATGATPSSVDSRAFTLGTTSPDSWGFELQNPANGFGGPAAGFDAGTALDIASGDYSVVDLYQYAQGGTTTPGTYLGSLELSSTGALTFTDYIPAAIPEPSTYAAILGVASLSLVAIRRRKQQVLA